MLGETDAANANFDEGVSIIADYFADDAEARADVGLARAVWNLGPPSAVEPVLHSALGRHQKKQGGQIHVARFYLSNLARVIKIPENDLYEEALRIETRILGPTHPAVERLRLLAGRQPPVPRLAELPALYEESLKMSKAKLGPDHPDTLDFMNKLAAAYQAAGRVAESLSLDEETLKLRRTVNGPQHADTLAVMTRMERSYCELGRLEDARKLHGEIQAVRDALKLPAEMQPVRVPMTDNPPPRTRTIRVTK